MAKLQGKDSAQKPSWGSVFNSPLAVAFISVLFFGALFKLWDSDRDDQIEQVNRRATFGKLLTEYQHRISSLSSVDEKIDYMLGHGPIRSGLHKLDAKDKVSTARWAKVTATVGNAEVDILAGRGAYVPTSPEFGGVSLQDVGSEVDQAGGFPDYQFATQGLFGLLDTNPSIIWLFVRSQMPQLTAFGQSRRILYAFGELPLRRYQQLTERQERILGIPTGSPAEIAKLERQAREAADRLHAEALASPAK